MYHMVMQSKRAKVSLGRRRSVYIYEDQWAAAIELARAEDRTINAVIRRALAAYIDEHGIVNGLSGRTRKDLRRMHMAWGGDGNIETPKA